ncbi:metal ABC transporter permease [Citricoccus muralis]|uniref:Metal ABC transporter permease n=1 Tax=Citricoccus muralis TaxID=169134 RepID=A0ABY8H924_9MICC|nr:metal ABC transporter permease [Citricoccus muralis]WFP17662.1 metal ABC transporter permease [Citricoccus muralis]
MDLITWLTEPFTLGFQQRALWGGMIAALMCSIVGVWLVLRGMSFFGDAFVHGVVPGLAAAVLFDFSPYLGAGIAALVMVAGMELIYRSTSLKEDTSIGLLFVGMMALGVVIISKADSYTGSLTSILFGDALGVSWDDIAIQAVFAGIVVVLSLLLYRPLMVLSFSPAKSQSLGMRPQFTHWMLLMLIATAVIGSYQAVGTLLVFGLLVGPAATAALVSRTVPIMIAVSVAIGLLAVWVGLLISFYAGTAASASMSLVPVVLFFVVLAVREVVRLVRRRRFSNGAGGRRLLSDRSPVAQPVDQRENPTHGEVVS